MTENEWQQKPKNKKRRFSKKKKSTPKTAVSDSEPTYTVEQPVSVTEQLEAVLHELEETVPPTEPKVQDIPEAVVTLVNEQTVTINEQQYELAINYRDAFSVAALTDRYTEILQRYHYIVGDWGFEQLRLRGFYASDTTNVEPDKKIDTLEDYLYEYCNFGCAYFVLALNGAPLPYKDEYSKSARNRRSRRFDPFAKVNRHNEYTTRKQKWNKSANDDKKRAKKNDKKSARLTQTDLPTKAVKKKRRDSIQSNEALNKQPIKKTNKPEQKKNFVIRKKGDRREG